MVGGYGLLEIRRTKKKKKSRDAFLSKENIVNLKYNSFRT